MIRSEEGSHLNSVLINETLRSSFPCLPCKNIMRYGPDCGPLENIRDLLLLILEITSLQNHKKYTVIVKVSLWCFHYSSPQNTMKTGSRDDANLSGSFFT